MFTNHEQLKPLHRYQLEVLFLFIAGFFLFIPYAALLQVYGLDTQAWQWYFFWPWVILYTVCSLICRGRISDEEKVDPLKRPIVHWVLLGITLLFFHLQPTNLQDFQMIDIMFAVCSLFMADAYWDFRKISLSRLRNRL